MPIITKRIISTTLQHLSPLGLFAHVSRTLRRNLFPVGGMVSLMEGSGGRGGKRAGAHLSLREVCVRVVLCLSAARRLGRWSVLDGGGSGLGA